MEKEKIQSDLLKVISTKIPDKTELVKKLMELLDCEKESIYRRLREETFFSFPEVVIIAEHLGISLDQLLGIDVSKKRPFSLVLNNFVSPSEEDYEMCSSYIRLLKVLSHDPTTTNTETWTIPPIPIAYQYPALTRFFFFKWACMYENANPLKKFHEIKVTKGYQELQKETLSECKKLNHTEYILSSTLFGDFVNDVYQYYLLGLIKKSEIKQIQKELIQMVNYLEELAQKGVFEETGKKVNIYISNIKVDINQCYIESDTYNFFMIKVLSLNGISSIDGTKNNNIKNWLSGQKRLSTLITQSGELERIRFFNSQRKCIEQLTTLIR